MATITRLPSGNGARRYDAKGDILHKPFASGRRQNHGLQHMNRRYRYGTVKPNVTDCTFEE